MISRRGFIGGCIAVFSTKALTVGGLHKEPRSWKQFRYREPLEHPTSPFYGIVIYGLRSDDTLFYVSGDVVNRSSSDELFASLLVWFNSYLSSDCDCQPGFNCELHHSECLDAAVRQQDLIERDLRIQRGIFVAKQNSLL